MQTELDIDPGNRRESPLVSAVKKKSYEKARVLLDHGADPNGYPVLHLAVYEPHDGVGNLDIVELLLAYGADPKRKDKEGHTAFKTADQIDGKEKRQMKSLLNKADALQKGRVTGEWKPKQ